MALADVVLAKIRPDAREITPWHQHKIPAAFS
jgi:hypothetical protein